MPPETPLARKTVAVADDTAFVRDRYRGAIEGAGHRVLASGSGGELIGQLRAATSPVDLVLLDLRLPGGGVNLVRKIRALDRPTPVAVFTGTIASEDEVQLLEQLDVVGYVSEYAATTNIWSSLRPHLFPEKGQRRTSPRIALGVPVTYRFGNTVAVALSASLSYGGVSIRTTSPLAIDTAIRVRVRLPTGEIETAGTVAWTNRRLGMGVRFSDVSPRDQARIDSYVRSHCFSNRKG